MQQLVAIAIGGSLGAVLRFVTSTHVHRVLGKDFPFGTLAVNVLGSFMMGLLFVLLIERYIISVELRAGIIFGFLGAFTTFSSFSFETLSLLDSGEWDKAMLNVLLSVICCLAATWLGIGIGRQL